MAWRGICATGFYGFGIGMVLRKAELAKPGAVYTISIPAGVTSNVFKAGHRIRLEVSSSNFPRFDHKFNTGRAIADETELRVANQTVYYGGSDLRISYCPWSNPMRQLLKWTWIP